MSLEMDILKRIKRFLNEEKKHPWPVGFNIDDASPEILMCWKMLTTEEQLAISKNNPFPAGRNKCLLALRAQGFEQRLLSDLSGLALITIQRIVGKKKTKK